MDRRQVIQRRATQ